MNEYVIASFRSRTQTVYFDKMLKMAGINGEVVSTPKEIAIGCGYSVKFPKENYTEAKRIYETYRPQSFVGFYEASHGTGGGKRINLYMG